MRLQSLTLSSSNTSSLDINLKAQCPLILPQRSSNSGFHTNRSNLTSCIGKDSLLTLPIMFRHRYHRWKRSIEVRGWRRVRGAGLLLGLRIAELDIIGILRVLAGLLRFLICLRGLRIRIRLVVALNGRTIGRDVLLLWGKFGRHVGVVDGR